MNGLRARMRGDSGQAMVFIVFALMGLVLMTGLVVDGGSWRRTQRQVQTAADSWKYYGLPKGAPGKLGLCRGGTGER